MADVAATHEMADPQRSRSKARRFLLLSKNKRQPSPPPPVPHYSPVSPLEDDTHKAKAPEQDIWPGQRSPIFSPSRVDTMSARSIASPRPASVFDEALDVQPQPEPPELVAAYGVEEPSYDLKPPPPSVSHSNIETLAGRLFSLDHINAILRDSITATRFTRFVSQFKPEYESVLKQYAESRKAILAVEYANAVAGHIGSNEQRATAAATLDRGFKAQMNQYVDGLVNDALPAYLTHRFTQLVTDTLVKEITQNGAPIMRELIPNLAEVYCITDPSLPDNPIVYASQEFYTVSQYGREYVIGRNCRFLQGPKTSTSTIQRLIDALKSGQEVCETVLNYRRDGSPFMNLLLIAPLYDNKGQVRYFLGCQVDISPLIEGGRGLESFEQLLAQDRHEARFAGALEKDPKHALSQLSQMLTEEEASVMRSRTATISEPSLRSEIRIRQPRRVLGADGIEPERPLWPHHSFGPSGRLPGVYQNYLLVRPYPSLRVTFVSPALRIPGLVQAKFLDRIGGPQHVRDGILDAMAHGTGVTAKIQWLVASLNGVGQPSTQMDGRSRWIHCTPLLGSDERVGVWMVVMVEDEKVTGLLRRPVPPSTLDGSLEFGPVHSSVKSGSTRVTRSNLYAEYLQDGRGRDDSAHAEVALSDDHFRNFDQ